MPVEKFATVIIFSKSILLLVDSYVLNNFFSDLQLETSRDDTYNITVAPLRCCLIIDPGDSVCGGVSLGHQHTYSYGPNCDTWLI